MDAFSAVVDFIFTDSNVEGEDVPVEFETSGNTSYNNCTIA